MKKGDRVFVSGRFIPEENIKNFFNGIQEIDLPELTLEGKVVAESSEKKDTWIVEFNDSFIMKIPIISIT